MTIKVMLFINFKNYQEASGQRAVKLAQVCSQVSKESGVAIIPCIQAVDLFTVARAVKIPVWVQHTDPKEQGKTTGWITVQAVKNAGAKGTLLNHSEHPMELPEIKKAVLLAKESELKIMVLAKNNDVAFEVDKLQPDYIGIEEPSLIGGKVSMGQLEEGRDMIEQFTAGLKNSIPVVGAGINKKEDIAISLSLGAKGVLVASAVVLSPNPREVLSDLTSAFLL